MPYKGSEKDKEYRANYLKENSKVYTVRLWFERDKDLINHVEKNRPSGEFFRRLIVEDMNKIEKEC